MNNLLGARRHEGSRENAKGIYMGPLAPTARFVEHASVLRQIYGEGHILPRECETLMRAMKEERFFGGQMARWPTRERDPISLTAMIEEETFGSERIRNIGYCIARESHRGYQLAQVIAAMSLGQSFVEDGDEILTVTAVTAPDAWDAHRALNNACAMRVVNEQHARAIHPAMAEMFAKVQEVGEQRHPGKQALMWMFGETAIRRMLRLVYTACSEGLEVSNDEGQKIQVIIEGKLNDGANRDLIRRLSTGEAKLPLKIARL